MSTTTEALDAVRLLVSRLDGLKALEGALTRIGSFENAEAESRAQMIVAQKGESDARLALQVALDNLTSVKAEALAVESKSKADTKEMVERASRNAEQLVADGEAKARGIVEEAKNNAARIVRDAQALANQSIAKASEKSKESNELQARIAIARQELDGLTKRIVAAKAQMAKMLSGD